MSQRITIVVASITRNTTQKLGMGWIMQYDFLEPVEYQLSVCKTLGLVCIVISDFRRDVDGITTTYYVITQKNAVLIFCIDWHRCDILNMPNLFSLWFWRYEFIVVVIYINKTFSISGTICSSNFGISLFRSCFRWPVWGRLTNSNALIV